jgi:hypothetical protein
VIGAGSNPRKAMQNNRMSPPAGTGARGRRDIAWTNARR